MPNPFPDWVEIASAPAEDIGSDPRRLNRQTNDQASKGLVDKFATIVARVDIASDTNFPGDEVINSDTTTPVSIGSADAGFEYFLDFALPGG